MAEAIEQLADALVDAQQEVPSDVLGQDGNRYAICSLDLMLGAIDAAGKCILLNDPDSAVYILAGLRERLLQDAALYERLTAEQTGASVRH
jgi:hypothetical protein